MCWEMHDRDVHSLNLYDIKMLFCRTVGLYYYINLYGGFVNEGALPFLSFIKKASDSSCTSMFLPYDFS